MARPKPIVLLTHREDVQTEYILAASALYTVMYQGKPFSHKRVYLNASGDITKYAKTQFTTQQVAENLADKLNRKFNCSAFTAERTA